MCPRPASWPSLPPSEGLARCPHPASRIRIDVTVDLGFVYCTECDRRLWWTRARGPIDAEQARSELRDHA
jgi:hypothetical protein